MYSDVLNNSIQLILFKTEKSITEVQALREKEKAEYEEKISVLKSQIEVS